MLYIVAHGSELEKWHHQIVELHNHVFPENVLETYQDICGCFNDPTWVLVSDKGKLVGMVAAGEDPRGTHVYNAAVDQNYRRSKIGTQMAEYLKQRFASGALRGRVDIDNIEAHSFYRAIGARQESVAKHHIYYTL